MLTARARLQSGGDGWAQLCQDPRLAQQQPDGWSQLGRAWYDASGARELRDKAGGEHVYTRLTNRRCEHPAAVSGAVFAPSKYRASKTHPCAVRGCQNEVEKVADSLTHSHNWKQL